MTQRDQQPRDQHPKSDSRRDFLKTSAAVSTAALSAGAFIGGPAFADDKAATSANEDIAFACIGVGGKGSSDSRSALGAGNVVAIVDVDRRTLKKASGTFKDAEQFTDFREMLDTMGDKVDAVTVSTPDHTHAVASLSAMRMGKHCFVQKPMTWSVGEARMMADVAKEKGLCTQMGNQGTASNGLRSGVEFLRAGLIGEAKELHVWTNRPIWPQGIDRPEGQKTPPYLDWNAFLGPAPERDYSPVYHPFKWRGWLDFGTGALGDMACHTMNLPVMALELFDPISVEVVNTSGVYKGETYPKYCVLKYEFAATDKRGPITMYWYDGGQKPAASMLQGLKNSSSGALVLGDKGKFYSAHTYGAEWDAYAPDGSKLKYEAPEQTLPRSPGHFQEFAAAIKKNDPSLALSNFPDYAGPLSETVLLGNLAVRSGEKVEWDAENLKGTNVDVSELVMRSYRDGWSLEG